MQQNNSVVPITKNQGFALHPQNMQEAMQFAEMLSSSNMVPKNYKGNPSDTMVAMMMGCELGLNPIQSLQNIAVINGRPAVWGDAMLALVQNHNKFSAIKETFDQSSMTATCVVTRKGSDPHAETFSQEDAQKAGLWGKQGPWTNYPKRMLALRARGFALRSQFADALSGLVSAEEAEDMVEIDITPQNEVVERIATLPPYPDEQLEASLEGWGAAIKDKKTSPDHLISVVGTKFIMTEKQKQIIQSLGGAE